MRVANIIEDARIAGPQIRNLKVSKTLNKKIFVTLIFPKENSKILENLCRTHNVDYLSLSLTTIKRSLIGIFFYIFSFPFEVFKLAKILKKNNYDLVHVSGGCWQSKGVFAAKIAQIKVVWELNDTYTPTLVRVFFFFFSRMANGFIFASNRTRKYYKKFISINTKSFVIQSPVDINLFDPNKKIKNEKFLNQKKFKKKIIIATVGNINPNKGHITFLKTAKNLMEYQKKIIFIVVGPIYKSQKKYFKFLKNFVKSNNIRNIYFTGPKEDIRPLLKSTDIYVCTSNNESSPLAVWEAMAMKKPIVSTNVGDVSKFVKNHKNGYVVNVKDDKSLAKCLSNLIKNTTARKKFGNLSRKTAKYKLNLDLCANLHLKAYKNIMLI